MSEKFEIVIASTYDRDNLVAEIWDNDLMIAEVEMKPKNLILEIYTKNSNILLDFDGFLDALNRVKLEIGQNKG